LNFFLLLVLAHLLGDYPLQTNWVYRQKLGGLLGVSWHTAILALCYAAVALPYLANWQILVLLMTLSLIHGIQDHLKVVLVDKRKRLARIPGLLLDQLIHLLALAGAAVWINSLQLQAVFDNPLVEQLYSQPVLLYLIVLLLSTFTWSVVKHVWDIAKSSHPELRHDWKAMLLRGVIVTVVFALIYLVG